MNVKAALSNNRLCKSLIWITPEQFKEILPIFEKELKQVYIERNKDRKRKFWQWRKWVLRTIEDKLFVILFYIKTYPTYDVLAFLYWVARSKPYYWISKFLIALERALWKKLVLPKRKVSDLEELFEIIPEIKEVYIDWTERTINRPKKSKYQKKYYSWKKKNHTVKNTVITNDKWTILLIWKTVEWKRHDKKLYDDEMLRKIKKDKYWDTWYIWWDWIITPKKKPKWKELTKKEKEDNKIISIFRVVVEHWIWAMKSFWVVWNKFRNRIYWEYRTVKINMKDMVISIAWWLANLKRWKMLCPTW